MKKLAKYISTLSIFSSLAISALAVPAKPGLMQMTTSDGSTLNVHLVGDEFFHQYFTEDGYPLVEKDGNFYYCDFDAAGTILDSGIKASDIPTRTASARAFLNTIDKSTLESRIRTRAELSPVKAEKMAARTASARKAPGADRGTTDGPPFEKGYGLFSDTHFPAYGEQKAIVILVEYTDVKFKTTYDAKDYFTRMLNEEGFSDLGGTGSAAQYFRENSEGAFIPEFDVFGPIQLAHNMSYYGGNNWWGDDQDPGAMVKEACDALDATVDFSEYDRDGDGIIDNIFIFYAGQGEASGGGANTVWPHSWDMTSAGYPNLYYDGVKVHTYGCSNEWETYWGGGRPDGVGTFIHEFSHVMGLPDLYATSYTSAFTPGEWSALDYGPYNNDGMTPPYYGAFERYALGWVKPREVDRALNATLQPIENNVCGIIRTTKDNEFFLLENRQQTGWDTYIPHHGMLIWHIDYNESVWNSNSVNNSSSHQYVDIEEADGQANSYTVTGDPFPGTSNKTSFTSTTSPAMKMWNGTAINYPITDIAEHDGIITFKVLGGAESEMEVLQTAEATSVGPDWFEISWSEPIEGNDVYLDVYCMEEGEKIFVEGYSNRLMGSAQTAVVTGLEPETTYFYTVRQSNGWETSASSEEKSVTTGRFSINYYAVEAIEARDVEDTSFTAQWLPLDDATCYFLSVYTKILGDPFYAFNGFDDGIANLGEWTVSSNVTTYGMSSYAGEATPSLRLPSGASLNTPVFEDGINEITFWHRGNSTSEGDRIDIYGSTPQGRLLICSVPVTAEQGGITTTVTDEIPEHTTQVQIQFIRSGNKGYLALDDVKIGHGYDWAPSYLEDYTELEVGNVLSYTVRGLNQATDYFYTVSATDGEFTSLKSPEIGVTTLDVSTGVGMTEATDALIRTSGLDIYTSQTGEILVSDLTGCIVARGHSRVRVPSKGLYIVTIPDLNISRKIAIK